jgi:pilus assembly protein FimV
MVRKTSLALMIAASLAPFGAYALGLGDIHLKSALNQELDADIDLLSVRTGELDTVKVELAGQDAYERAGIDRSFLLTQLRFNPARLPDGSAVIEVTSREPVREPFLNFLIEVNWPQGRLLREYTVLLDPPATMDRRPPRVATPAATTPVSRAAERPAVPAGTNREQYGPVAANETLWEIAEELRPSGVSIEQMMIALQRANPSAFYKDNINYLKRGVILRVPGSEELGMLSTSAARTAFLEQTARWESERGVEAPGAPVAAVEPTTPAVAPPGEPTPDELRILAAPSEGEAGTVEGGEAGKVAELQDELLLAREANESARQQSSELKSRVADLESQLADVQRLLKLKDDQLAELQAALSDAGAGAERPAAMLQPAPEVLEPVMAEGMASAEEQPVTGETTSGAAERGETVEARPEAVAEVGPSAEPESEISAPEPGEEAAAAEPEGVDAGMPEEAMAPVSEELELETALGTELEPTVTEPEPAAQTEPAPTPRTSAKSGDLVQFLLEGSGLYWIGGGIGVVLLGGIGAALAGRRRKPEEEAPEESILVDLEEQPAEPPVSTLATSGETDAQTDETSFLSDFSPSDIDALQDETGEVDPISEADVYMAYNRYQQAEELLRQGIKKEQGRTELRLKLLEVLFAAQSVEAFVDEAEKLAADGAANDYPQDWARVVSMGQDVAPDNPLFAEGAAEVEVKQPAPSGDETAVVSGNDQDDLADLDLGDVESELEAASTRRAGEPDEETAGEEEEVSEVDFGDSVFEFVDEAPESEQSDNAEQPREQSAAAQVADDLEVGDLDVDSSSDFVAESSRGLEEGQAEEEDFDFTGLSEMEGSLGAETAEEDLGELDLGLDSDAGSATDDLGGSLADETLDFDRMESIPGEDSVSIEGLDSDVAELGVSDEPAMEEAPFEAAEQPVSVMDQPPSDEDEVATKLDLARAYIDMGDEDGARSILDEVLTEGNDAQQTEAKELMQQMA